VNRKVDCDVFQDQLDLLAEGRLPDAGIEQLKLHAASCPECAMQLQMHEHLAAQSLSDLEASVPDELVGSVWPRVKAEIAAHGSTLRSKPGRWMNWNRIVPVLAATTLVLCVGSGLLYRKVGQLLEREAALVQRVAEQDRRLAQLATGLSRDPVERAARLAGKSVWERALERRNNVSVAELEAMLRTVPAQTTMLDVGAFESLGKGVPFWSVTAVEAALSEIDSADGIQAGELLQAIGAMNISPDRRIATAHILAISRGVARPGRS